MKNREAYVMHRIYRTKQRKQQRIFQNLKRYLQNGMVLLAYVKIVSFTP